MHRDVVLISVEDHQSRELEECRRSFLCWLAADDLTYQEDLNRASLSKDPGTCGWIQDSCAYKEFIESSRGSIFWLHGKPGCGVSHPRFPTSPQCTYSRFASTEIHHVRRTGQCPSNAVVLLLQTVTDPMFIMVDVIDEAENASKVISWLQAIKTEGSGKVVWDTMNSRHQMQLDNQPRIAISLAIDPRVVDRDIEKSILCCIRQIASKHGMTDSRKIDSIQEAKLLRGIPTGCTCGFGC